MNIAQICKTICMQKSDVEALISPTVPLQKAWELVERQFMVQEQQVRSQLSEVIKIGLSAPEHAKIEVAFLASAMSGLADDLDKRRNQLREQLES